MDHDTVVRQKMTERYLLDELDARARDEFEEHYFDCTDCAADVHAGALFVEQSKIELAENPSLGVARRPVMLPGPPEPGWLAALHAGLHNMLRPALVAPVMILLLAVVGYQNLVTYPHLQQALTMPQVLPWASVNVGTYGSETPIVTTAPGSAFLLFVRIPPEGSYSHYIGELYNSAGKIEESFAIPVSSEQKTAGQDQWPVQISAAHLAAGNYTLAVRGVGTTGDNKEVGRASFELQIQK
jgi:hypothetical protein